MKEIKFSSHRDPQAEVLSHARNTELPSHKRCGHEASYDKVLHTMRNQEMLFYSASRKSGY